MNETDRLRAAIAKLRAALTGIVTVLKPGDPDYLTDFEPSIVPAMIYEPVSNERLQAAVDALAETAEFEAGPKKGGEG